MASRPHKGAIRRENETRIKRAAERIFSEQGYRGASIGMIAELAEVPKPNVYYYFGSKEELYQAVIEDICASWLKAGDDFHVDNAPRDAVKSYVLEKMDLARERPHASRVWAMEIARGAPVIKSYLKNTVRPWLREKEEVINQWIKDGQIKPVDGRAFIFMIWATTQHYADFEAQITVINDGRGLTDAKFSDARQSVCDLILHSLQL